MSFNDLESGLGTPGPIHLNPDDDERLYKDLIVHIAQQIFQANSNLTNIERLVSLVGGSKDTPELRNNLHDANNATRDLIKDTTQDLKMLASIKGLSKNRQRYLRQQKLSKDFQTVVSQFQRLQHASADKLRTYIDHSKATAVMLQDQLEATEEGMEQEQQLAMSADHQRQIEAMDNEIEYNELLISERENEILNIEHGITELNEIFRDMSMLVNEQEDGIQSIYGNILSIAQNTRQAADELVTASHYQRNARRSMCCFFLIISIVGSILAVIIVIAK
ncbi:t-SNARE [Choanephora cucurbitarum]|nr:t-SNARE [Choanephora cucurbitarum]